MQDIPAIQRDEESGRHACMNLPQGLPLQHSGDFWIVCPCCLVVEEGEAGWEFSPLFCQTDMAKHHPTNRKNKKVKKDSKSLVTHRQFQ